MRHKSNQHIADAHKANGRATVDFDNIPELSIEEQVLVIKNIAAWINEREFFWLMEIRTEFKIGSYDTKTHKLPGMLAKFIRELKRKNILMGTGTNGSQRQFMRTTVIDIEDIGTGTYITKWLKETDEK